MRLGEKLPANCIEWRVPRCPCSTTDKVNTESIGRIKWHSLTSPIPSFSDSNRGTNLRGPKLLGPVLGVAIVGLVLAPLPVTTGMPAISTSDQQIELLLETATAARTAYANYCAAANDGCSSFAGNVERIVTAAYEHLPPGRALAWSTQGDASHRHEPESVIECDGRHFGYVETLECDVPSGTRLREARRLTGVRL